MALESSHRTKSVPDLSVGDREELWGVKGGNVNQGADERDPVKLSMGKRMSILAWRMDGSRIPRLWEGSCSHIEGRISPSAN